ncbi:MAG: lipid-binding protein [Bacteroidales bacterium]|nr:lipid-binding protein [Bacteroidales bacterium]
MKRLLVAIMMLGAALATSCKKDEIKNTATVDMAGEWAVTVDIVDETGEAIYGEDPYGYGTIVIATFNTAENRPDKMFVSDCENFWSFQVPVNVDQKARTFASDGAVDNVMYECKVTVTGGKITPGGALTPSGMPADAIEFCAVFDDDDDGFIYHFHGYRYSGLTADE